MFLEVHTHVAVFRIERGEVARESMRHRGEVRVDPHLAAHALGELAFLDEAPAGALGSATVVARTGNAEDVADHHVVMPRNVLPQLAQEVVLLDAAWPHERADVVPVRTVQRHHRPIPTEPDDMAVLAQVDEIGQLHRTLADLRCVIHVERVHGHRSVLQPQCGPHNPVLKTSRSGRTFA